MDTPLLPTSSRSGPQDLRSTLLEDLDRYAALRFTSDASQLGAQDISYNKDLPVLQQRLISDLDSYAAKAEEAYNRWKQMQRDNLYTCIYMFPLIFILVVGMDIIWPPKERDPSEPLPRENVIALIVIFSIIIGMSTFCVAFLVWYVKAMKTVPSALKSIRDDVEILREPKEADIKVLKQMKGRFVFRGIQAMT